MLTQYLLAFLWGIVVLIAFVGYGRFINAVLSPQNKFDLGMQAAFGLALSVVIGGFLNFVGVISVFSIQTLIFIGILLFLIFWIKNCREWPLLARKALAFFQKNKIFIIAATFVFIIILARYCFSVAFFSFHVADDQLGYMTFPVKMVQTGSLGIDPFSERRTESSLGGQYFLHAIILAPTSLKNLHLTDSGLGYLIFTLLLIGFLRKKKINRWLSLIMVLLIAIVVSPVANITACYTAAAIFFLFFRLSYPIDEFKNNSTLFNALAVALSLSALCALKSTFISVAVILFFGHYFIYYRRLGSYKAVLKEFVAAALIIIIFLLPWMLSMLESSGTLLYPIFGRGYQAMSHGVFTHALQFDFYSLLRLFFEFFAGLTTLVPLVALGAVAYVLVAGEEKKFFWLVFLSSLVGVLIIVFLIGGYSLYYYSFPYLLPSIMFAIVLLFGRGLYFSRFPNLNSRIIGLVFVTFLLGSFLQKDLMQIQEIKGGLNIERGRMKIGLMNSDLVNEKELKQYSDLQKSVPVGATIIARLDRNFLFDFNRNRIYINDAPGDAGLPPGLPLKNGSEAMADYFLAHNIRYVAYSNVFNGASLAGMLRPHVNPLLRAQAENSFAFQNYLIELSKTRKIIYDDGKNLVLDVSIKVISE